MDAVCGATGTVQRQARRATMIPHVPPVPPVSCLRGAIVPKWVFPQPARLKAIGSDFNHSGRRVRPTITAEGGVTMDCVLLRHGMRGADEWEGPMRIVR